jgi:hypothetical protein
MLDSTVKWKRRGVSGSEFRSGDPGKPTLYPPYIPVGDFPSMELPTQKLALIREKRALFYTGNPLAAPVLLSVPELKLKMVVFSIIWEAKLGGAG